MKQHDDGQVEAPERVTLSHSQYAGWYLSTTGMRNASAVYIDYVRADLYDAVVAERDALKQRWLKLCREIDDSTEEPV